MTSQETINTTRPIDEETLAQIAAQLQDSLAGEVVIEGTVITSASDTPQLRAVPVTQVRAIASLPPGERPTLTQFILGSVLVLTDELGERIVVDPSEIPSTTRTPESVFRPVSEFEELLGGEQYRRTRYLALGVAEDAKKAAERGIDLVDDVTDTAGRAFWRVAGPFWNSTLFRPIRRPVQRWQERGETQVQKWIITGMAQEQISRNMATASLNNLVHESVTDITNNVEVQEMVQEVIQSQSVSMVTLILQEIRERLISMDIWIQGVFGTAMPAQIPSRDSYLRALAERRPQHEHADLTHSMAGYTGGFVTRFVAFAIDIVILLLTYSIASAALSGTLQLFGLTDLVSRFLTSGSLFANITLALLGLASFLLISSYGVISWYLTGETVGDSIMGIQVVDIAGGRLSFWRSVRRMIGVYVAAIPFFIGFIWVLFDKQRRGWHDRVGGTYVVYDWPARPDEDFMTRNVTEELANDARANARNYNL